MQSSTALSLFPSRPQPSNTNNNKKISLTTNFYRLGSNNKQVVHKYTVKITPEIADNSKLVGKIIFQCDDALKAKLHPYKPWRNWIYSYKMLNDPLQTEVCIDNIDYQVSVEWSKSIS